MNKSYNSIKYILLGWYLIALVNYSIHIFLNLYLCTQMTNTHFEDTGFKYFSGEVK